MAIGSTIQTGRQYRFAYPIYFKTLPDYSEHRGHIVTVLRELGPEESDHHVVPELEILWKVQAADGWIGNAFDSELEPIME